MICEINEKVKLYRHIRSKMSEIELDNWQEKFAVEYTHDSTAIEGNTLTLRQTRMVLIDKITPGEVKVDDVLEVRAHNDAFNFIQKELQSDRPINEELIKDIQERVVPAKEIGGIYRDINGYIAGAQSTPPDHSKVREEMKFFIADLKEKDKSLDPIEKAAWIHAEFGKYILFKMETGVHAGFY